MKLEPANKNDTVKQLIAIFMFLNKIGKKSSQQQNDLTLHNLCLSPTDYFSHENWNDK